MLAVPGERPTRKQTIVIDRQRIVAMVDGIANPDDQDDAMLYALSDHFVLPGLMDMHGHFQGVRWLPEATVGSVTHLLHQNSCSPVID